MGREKAQILKPNQQVEGARFATDSPVEKTGFEPSVPTSKGRTLGGAARK
jgi:hypothetical protein